MTSGTSPANLSESVAGELRREYQLALKLIEADGQSAFLNSLPTSFRDDIKALGSIHHNGRGVVITLAACKCANMEQDISAHLDKHDGGFGARGIDKEVVVPLLREWGLGKTGESHWLTYSLISQPYTPELTIATTPKIVGRVVPRLVCNLNNARLCFESGLF